jgi:hypothetical protein
MRRMARLPLAQVTLCAVDTRCPSLAMQSLMRSMAQVDFGRVVLFTHGWHPAAPAAGIELVDIGPIRSGADYSSFVLRRLPAHVRTSHVLVTQWDGFVVDAGAWTDEFLAYDYVGAVWPELPPALSVGNGGFSLRSRRLLEAGLDARIEEEHPEDQRLCGTYRQLLEQQHRVQFAPPALARQFAFENERPRGPTFGFHGPYNLPRVLDEPLLIDWLALLPDEFFRSRDARRLGRALLAHGMAGAAGQLVARRRAAGRNDPNTRLLGLASAVLGRLRRAGGRDAA